MAEHTVKNLESKQIYWWTVFNTTDDGFNFSKMLADVIEHPPDKTFTTKRDAFVDFHTTNPTLVVGDTQGCIWEGSYLYESAKKSSIKNSQHMHVLLSKDDGTTAIMIYKLICDPDIMAEYPPTPPKLLEEMENLRKENTLLRFKSEGKVPFYVPVIESLANTRRIANAFASFIGSYIVNYSSRIAAAGDVNTFAKDVDKKTYHTLLFSATNRKEYAMVCSAAITLGLAKDTFQKRILRVTHTVPQVEMFTAILEHTEFDTHAVIDKQISSQNFDLSFKSNQPLLRMLTKSMLFIDTWINAFDDEQAIHMLRAMAVGTTDTFDTIEVMEPHLCSVIDTLCARAGYSREIEVVEDLLWIFKFKKEICVSEIGSE